MDWIFGVGLGWERNVGNQHKPLLRMDSGLRLRLSKIRLRFVIVFHFSLVSVDTLCLCFYFLGLGFNLIPGYRPHQMPKF